MYHYIDQAVRLNIYEMFTDCLLYTSTSHFFSELQADPSLSIDFIIAPPRMAYYMEYSTRIYQVYLKYIAPEDIVVYSCLLYTPRCV